jgi:terminase small subunit-like protein
LNIVRNKRRIAWELQLNAIFADITSGLSMAAACARAEVSRHALIKMLRRHPELRERYLRACSMRSSVFGAVLDNAAKTIENRRERKIVNQLSLKMHHTLPAELRTYKKRPAGSSLQAQLNAARRRALRGRTEN